MVDSQIIGIHAIRVMDDSGTWSVQEFILDSFAWAHLTLGSGVIIFFLVNLVLHPDRYGDQRKRCSDPPETNLCSNDFTQHPMQHLSGLEYQLHQLHGSVNQRESPLQPCTDWTVTRSRESSCLEAPVTIAPFIRLQHSTHPAEVRFGRLTAVQAM